jgi:hypothetical protein
VSPSDQAMPELVEARALNPKPCSSRALPASQGFGITKQPSSCSLRNWARLSAADGIDLRVKLKN